MKKIYFSIIAFFYMLCVQSCQKEEISKVSFWEILAGTWKLDGTFRINEEAFDFTEYDLNGTYITFKEPQRYTSGAFTADYIGSRIDVGRIFEFKNENGLKNRNGLGDYSEVWNFFNFDDATHKTERYYTGTNWDNKVIEATFPITAKIKSQYSNKEEIEQHLQEEMIDYLSVEDANVLPGTVYHEREYFKLNLKDANTLEIRSYSPYYRRVVNGEYVNDEIVFTVSRINESDIVTVPPFSLSDYEVINHLKLDEMDDLYKRGNAKISSNGVDNGCLSLQNTADYVQLEYEVRPTVPMTLSFWINPNRTNRPKQVIYSKYKNQYGPFIMSIEGNKFALEVNDGFGNLQKVSSSKEINSGEWNHICFSVDEDNLATLYINGAADSQGTINSLTVDASAEVLLGTTQEAVENNLDIHFKGFLDEFIFFEKVLTEPEIAQLHFWHLNN